MEFRLLGPLEVWDDGRALELGGQKRRALLALLLLHTNEVVSSDRLIEELWGEEPPQAAATALHGHVSRLRKLLGGADGGAEQLLVTRPPGYVLQLEPDQLDLHRFERLREEARATRSKGDLVGASAKLRDALTLWRGPPLADLAYERFAQVECGRLEELRLATIEERIEIDLALGRHGDVSSELERLVADHPLREGFRAQLMLALYRSGRQAEALQVYQQGRRVLVEELGIDPSQRLRDLEQAILRQDESLRPPVVPSARELADKPNHRPLLLISAACAIAGAVALGLLVPRLGGGKAAAAFRPGTVLLDLKTNKQSGFLPPSQLLAPFAPVYAGGHVWLLNASPKSIVELDPATGRMRPFALPSGAAESGAAKPFAVGRHALWVGAGDDLVEIDPRIGQEVDRFKLDKITGAAGQAEGVAVGGGLVWVGRDVGLGQVIALDPRTRKIRYRFPVRHHADLAFGNGFVWAADSAGVDVIDTRTHVVTPVREIEKTDWFFGPNPPGNAVAFGGGFGWTTDPAKGIVYKIDRSGQLAEQYRTGLGATGASFTEGRLWVRNEDAGTVTRLDPVTGEKTEYRFGHPVAAEVAAAGVLLAALEPGRTTEDRIEALKGNVLRLFSKQGALGQGYEPALNWDYAAAQIEFATCANLLNYPDKPPPEGWRLQPEVAAAMPTLSRDRRTYRFRIRRGYRFSPPVGQALTAKTFRYSIERALSHKLAPDPKGSGPAAFSVQDIQGEQAFRQGRARHISGLRAAGNRLSITLTKPSPGFLQRLSGTGFCPVPRGTPFVQGAANRSVGPNAWTIPSAGPYYVAEWRNDKYAILKRNPYYHGPRPHSLDAIALREGVDVTVALERIRQGGWDGIVSSGDTSAAFSDSRLDPGGPLAERYGNALPDRIQYVPAPLPHTTYLLLNSARGPFADVSVRRAVAFAVDRTAIAPLWDSIPSDQLLPPVTGGFRERRLYPLRPALARARALMRGRRLEAVMPIDRPGDASLLREALLLKAELRPIGIRVKLKPLDSTRLYATGRPQIDVLDGGVIDGPDGAAFLMGVFTPGYTVPRTWLTPEVRQAVARVNRLSGSERQAAAGALADRLVVREVPLVVIGHRAPGELFAPTVGCRIFAPAVYGVDLAALCRRHD